jgi:hypothetical protein
MITNTPAAGKFHRTSCDEAAGVYRAAPVASGFIFGKSFGRSG